MRTISLSQDQIRQAIAHYVEDTCGGRVELSGVLIGENDGLVADVEIRDGVPVPSDGLTCSVELSVTYSNGDKFHSSFQSIQSRAPEALITLVKRSRVAQRTEAKP